MKRKGKVREVDVIATLCYTSDTPNALTYTNHSVSYLYYLCETFYLCKHNEERTRMELLKTQTTKINKRKD